MLSLLSEWKYTQKGAVEQGIEFKTWLRGQFEKNSAFISERTTEDIAQMLRLMKRITPDETTLIPIYETYKPENNHVFNAWDYSKRAELMRVIETDEILRTLTDRLEILERYNQLHAQVYEFEADTVMPKEMPPKFFSKDGGLLQPEEIKAYNANQMTEVLSSGYHDKDNKAIVVNTYYPSEEGKIVPTFHQGNIKAAGLILHEGRHTMMGHMAQKIDAFTSQEFRDIATILHLNTFGSYYLRGGDYRNHLNPCEKDAYGFQRDMEEFLAALPEERSTIISKMEKRRDWHSAQINRSFPNNPQPAYALAA